MSYQADFRDRFLGSLAHAQRVLGKLRANAGHRQIFDFADGHKLCEGLFLSAWTDWEVFVRELVIADLAEDPKGHLARGVRSFRYKYSRWHLSELLLTHPDHPERYVEWDYNLVKSRAEQYLGQGHRFARPLPKAEELALMKRIRNAIAHGSQKARDSFLSLARGAPFNLRPGQLRWLSVGRFLYSHQWGTNFVIEECFSVHETNARHLVP